MTWPEAFVVMATLVALLVFTYFLVTGLQDQAARRREEDRLGILGLVKFDRTPEWRSTTTYKNPDTSMPEKSESKAEKKP